jgi:cysteine-rich secretory family protein
LSKGLTFRSPRAILCRPLASRRLITLAGASLLLGALIAYQGTSFGGARPRPVLASTSPWLDRLNAWRAGSAVSALTENATYDQGDYDHAVYMVKNDLVTHYETAGTPYYSVAGDTAARNSNIYVSSSTSTTDLQAIDWWMQAPFHAMGMMDPRLTQTGFGSYRQSKSGWDMGAALNVIQGNPFTGGQFPVYFPGNGTTEPLTTYGGNEFPDPLQACSGYAAPTGLPVFVELGGNVSTKATASSFTGNGVQLAHCVIDSTNAALSSYLTSRGGVILVPRAPLQTGVTYAVSLTVNGTVRTWSFTVGPLTPGMWTASYDLSMAPPSWTASQTQAFNVTVTNTGNQTWVHTDPNPVMLDMHFTTQTGGSSKMNYWSTSQIYALPSDVAPSGSLTFSVSVTAPTTSSGPMSLEAELFKNQQFWFQQSSAVAVTVAPATWTAAYAFSPPTSWTGGQTQNVSLTLTNTGNQTWVNTGPNPVMLDVNFSTQNAGNAVIGCCWKTSQLYNLPSSVAPGGSVTFTVAVTAPTVTGSYFLEAQLFKNQQFWFPAWSSVSASVNATWSAAYSFNPSTSWIGGQSQNVSVTLTNTGNQTWVNTGANPVMLDVNFSTQNAGNAVIGCCWKTSQLYSLPSSVAPGGSVTFTVSVTAPTTGGSYFLEAQLFKNQQFWFSTWQSVSVSVSATWTVTYSFSPSTSWTAGQTQSVSITLTNTGNQTWVNTGANPVMLDVNFSTQNGGNAVISCCWKTSQLYNLPSTVAPGASVTFTVNVTAPSATGSYYLEAQLFKNQQFWFGTWKSVAVTVS